MLKSVTKQFKKPNGLSITGTPVALVTGVSSRQAARLF